MICRTEVLLAPLTTLRIGGVADRMVELERESDVVDAVRSADRDRGALFILGEGSNVVVGDGGFAGLVARMGMRGHEVRRADDRVTVDVAAGEPWDRFVSYAVDEGWRGLECMSGIPGLVGATPVQNVGAYGQEVAETIARVRAFDRDAGAFVDLDRNFCRFAYRNSVFKRSPRWIVTSVRFELEVAQSSTPVHYAELAKTLGVAPGTRVPLQQVRETVLALRRRKGMVVDPTDSDSTSAGSFFVNPIVDAEVVVHIEARAGEPPPFFAVGFAAGEGRYKVPAAWLVERAGFPKGWGSGRVGVSRKHALALVNRGGASAAELLAAARKIRDGVHSRFGVVLEPEPVMVGCSWNDDGL